MGGARILVEMKISRIVRTSFKKGNSKGKKISRRRGRDVRKTVREVKMPGRIDVRVGKKISRRRGRDVRKTAREVKMPGRIDVKVGKKISRRSGRNKAEANSEVVRSLGDDKVLSGAVKDKRIWADNGEGVNRVEKTGAVKGKGGVNKPFAWKVKGSFIFTKRSLVSNAKSFFYLQTAVLWRRGNWIAVANF
jgi:hypothetical protein